MNPDLAPMQLGLFLLVAGMTIVFSALLTLMVALKVITRWSEPGAKAAPAQAPVIVATEPEVSGVLLAAIATTLVLDLQRLEDEERLVLTMRALPKPYSNWWQGRMARQEMWRPHVTAPRTDTLRADPPQGSDRTR